MDDIKGVVDKLETLLRDQQEKVAGTKRTINEILALAGHPPRYTIETENVKTLANIASDQFYGRPMATAVREVLEMRRAAGDGPASVAEIYDTLLAGGYEFQAKNRENGMRGLYISLGKNVAMFHKLPNGKYGLLSWYPNAKGRKTSAAEDADEGADAGEASG